MTVFSPCCAVCDILIVNDEDFPRSFSGCDVHNWIVTSIPVSIRVTLGNASLWYRKPSGDSGCSALHTEWGLFD